jgi:hypothetical protein
MSVIPIMISRNAGWFFATAPLGTPQAILWGALARHSKQEIPPDKDEVVASLREDGNTVTLAWHAYPTAV